MGIIKKMIQEQTLIKVFDNSGAKNAKCIKVLNKKSKAEIGDLIIVTITQINKNYNFRISKIKKGSIFLAIVVGLKKIRDTKKSTLLLTNENSVCLLNKQKKLLASRINKLISKDLKKKKLLKLGSLSI